MKSKIRVLVVDDSAFMRMAIKRMLSEDPQFEVVGEAVDGEHAVDMARNLKPDVITMDVEMPKSDGITATREILKNRNVAIIMVSSITNKGAKATAEAMEAGAVDFISKSSSFVQLDITNIELELKEKIKFWAQHPTGRAPGNKIVEPALDRIKMRRPVNGIELVLVGVSTGGPKILPDLIKACGELTCPMLIAQHMPPLFTACLARSLSEDTGISAVEGENNMLISDQKIVILPGGKSSKVIGSKGNYRLKVYQDSESPVCPSVDVLFFSAAKILRSGVAVILTGMGDDGSRGLKALAMKNFPVLAQSPESCIVSGMPEAAIKGGTVSEIHSVVEIGARLSAWVGST